MKELFKALLSKWTCHHVWKDHLQIINRKMGHTIEVIVVCEKCGKFKRLHV